jgi:RNA polymerase sigma-70 factor (ECF subfamily)
MKRTIQALADQWLLTNSASDFTELYKELHPRLNIHLMKLLKDSDDRNEALCTTFENILLKKHQYNPKWAFNTWSYRIATNEALLQFRRKKNIAPLEDIQADQLEQCDDFNNDETKSQIYQLALKVILELPTDYKNVMSASMSGMSYEEIAEELEMPLNTIRTKLRRARQLVREGLIKINPKIEEEYKGYY